MTGRPVAEMRGESTFCKRSNCERFVLLAESNEFESDKEALFV